MAQKLRKGLIVSCQALPEEPLYGGDTMEKMAFAAMLGGADGIRSNGVRDINGIAKKIGHSLPIIGLVKANYPDSPVYITPTLKEAKKLLASDCDVIALDATSRPRPHGEKLEDIVAYIRAHSAKPLMADIAAKEDILLADKLGFDYVSTTLRGYTEATEKCPIPDFDFLSAIVTMKVRPSLVAEGGIKDLADVRRILALGFEYVVIGGAITRPRLITEYYKSAFPKGE